MLCSGQLLPVLHNQIGEQGPLLYIFDTLVYLTDPQSHLRQNKRFLVYLHGVLSVKVPWRLAYIQRFWYYLMLGPL